MIDDYLRDPGGTVSAAAEHVVDWFYAHWLTTVPAVAAGVAVFVGVRVWWRRDCRHRLHDNARTVTILPPPTVDPAGGVALWAHLVGLLRPRWKRLLAGQPHLAFEYVFSHDGVSLRLWVPGVIPPGLVERAVEAAWPGAHTHSGPAEPPLPTVESEGHRVVVGGELRLARGDALPIRTDFDTDPIRALIAAPVGLGRREYACVQVCARPVTGRRLARARTGSRFQKQADCGQL
ncbi:hypothetical protein GCM10011581_48330 [Saccharopolyspora subtropica]|uniref:DUF8128 domain-containing protein n=1 Tax=Saccharopolyspora thermophila TaxID=89367 RepID=A0A917K8X9_9PSEU|nr:hypothetical protein GCM10011581_48330 [Saccharopolyspora subtropica]